MYNFDNQNTKGKFYEKHFFEFLKEKGQNPEFHNDGQNNKEFDISANGLKYEVKADFYDNKRFPIELAHCKNDLTVLAGWLHYTKSDYIVFYKPNFNQRFYFRTDKLKSFLVENLVTSQVDKITKNQNMKTWNLYLTEDELKLAEILIRTETY